MREVTRAEVNAVEGEKEGQRVARLANVVRGGVERRRDCVRNGKRRGVFVNAVNPDLNVPCALSDRATRASNLGEDVGLHSSWRGRLAHALFQIAWARRPRHEFHYPS